MSKTKTISARVPVDVYEMVENTCKHKGLNKSQLIQDLITQAPSKQSMKVGGEVANVTGSTMPEEIRHMLSAAGGLGAGLLVYNVLDEHLPSERFQSEEMKRDVMILCSIAVGMGAMFGLSKLLKSV